MRHVYNNKQEAEAKGKRARQDVINLYSQEKVNEIVMNRLQDIYKLVK